VQHELGDCQQHTGSKVLGSKIKCIHDVSFSPVAGGGATGGWAGGCTGAGAKGGGPRPGEGACT
jgi:hypothetical protein